MAKNKKNENNDILLDFEDAFNDYNEDLLKDRNNNVLASFGNSITEQNNEPAPIEREKASSPLDALRAKVLAQGSEASSTPVTPAEEPKETPEEQPKEPQNEKTEIADEPAEEEPKDLSLLEKLKRYTTDESGHDAAEDDSPLYKLESVAEIIKNDSNSLIDILSQKYDVTVDTLGKPSEEDFLLKGIDDEEPAEEEAPEEVTDTKQGEAPTPTPEFEKLANESKQRFEKNLFDELFPSDSEPKKEAKKEATIPDISDIDNLDSGSDAENEEAAVTEGATVRFTPVVDESGHTGRINISSSTKPIDIRQELTSMSENEDPDTDSSLEMSDFDLFLPKDEITDLSSAKAEIKRLSYKKRRNFLSCTLCALCVFALLLFFIPILADKTISSPASTMTVCGIFFLISVIANIDMFKDIIGLFKKRAGHDCVISLCAVMSIALCIFAVTSGENVFHLILLGSLIMFVRSVISFMQTSAMLSNLKKLTLKGTKHAFSFIKDSSTALAMAKNSIEGDVLVAAPRKAEFISDFMKYSLFRKKFGGKMPIVFIATLAFSVLAAVIAAIYYKTAFDAVKAATIASMIGAMPIICFIDALPLFSAAKRLNKKGAMINGIFGAESIELANAAVVNSNDIFPSGTIVLKSFKVLSNNNIDKIIVNAAALTEEIGSPLAPIFNQIAGTNTSYEKPNSDTIKYEETLGVSGWVDDELLFIGNRTLMETHGIKVPSFEVDKRILQNDCFPIYVATTGQACALIIVQYTVRKDIQKVLHKISNLGITLLVDNCDPNVTEEMICDYFGMYDDSVKVMTNVGSYMYKNATTDTNFISAPAAFRANKFSLLNIMCCASNIRISNIILSVLYILAAIFGVWYFVFTSFTQSGGIMSGASLLVFELLATAIAFILYLFKKP
ncbi:MAG: hypothetical protein J5852_04435 [Clostridia bacterium]|nr:hypothetical protein [Clostridia bacterium]